ncbi:acetolactate synthase small subunit [Flagellimonas taeanensis]|jgi:acetolactate synthase-1/3 small subunit|uniref:Acetolactate synthase small subunit n=1 Tax=Flagellimonas taeanensis TaxID=1005926 RepID=A0A1M6ZKX7_9FLAO|nr:MULTISPECIES: acetolactate synthase small subunit [Allomuricauda]MDC6386372.1 acetolactate synthase small subunit [Muricauda sp. SK9]RIV47955.1 acetolactate synthase small subunit [Allomuricauda taeanensis]SFC30724.1 acetolactate synthase, small subunit [Allomuricauda taeanensis]SHL31013.1 acetolactate synthase, small subunit [Allomuricauda taeanensis]
MEKQWFTISVYSENHVGLLNRISGIFLKRHINIESLNVSKSEIEGVSKFTIVIYSTEDWAIKIVNQIEKQVEVIKAYYHTDDETIYQESALFKIASNLLFDERQIQNIIKDSNSQIVTVSREFFVLAKTGRRHEIDEMHDALEPYGIMQFVRSGRIAVTKAAMPISEILTEFQEN